MVPLTRLVYASKATGQFGSESGGVDLGVARILTKSRLNNPKRGICGALYYGNGYFLQCLEGPTDQVLDLVETLKADSRHEEFEILLEEKAASRMFESWSMKQVAAQQDVTRFLISKGMSRFNPYRLSIDIIRNLLLIFAQGVEALPVEEQQNAHEKVGFFTKLKRSLLGA